ncbi:S1C family serine protease [Roseateles sp.]|uniref:S1C family serine protease n=1 Tax=Roseateles sp. TaxID=1971397 RepID=UPI0025E3165A|nr:serine protease [Roseateles sp.]MBV8037587.1 trypsin-like peptidase domain-containing protein [Roseateles sp.]
MFGTFRGARLFGLALGLLAGLSLQGCASSTQLITNQNASSELKTKSYKSYKEILFVPPKEDARQVAPRIVAGLESMGFRVTVMPAGKPVEASQGTGFVVGADGLLLTCAHVLGEFKEATVTLNGQRLLADVVQADKEADLALLRLREPLPAGSTVLPFRGAARPAAMGDDVFTIGYPLSRLLGNAARMTRGLVSATAGMRDNPKELQVTAEIQPGNSGGPLLDREGNVVGVISKTLNAGRVAAATGGALPQNVNFAIKSGEALSFVKTVDEAGFGRLAYDKASGLEAASKGVAKIQAGIVAPESERADKMVVHLSYISMWDLWYRFRMFLLAAFDHETQEPLFIAGQGRDNLVSNEDVVIRDTLQQFRKEVNSR